MTQNKNAQAVREMRAYVIAKHRVVRDRYMRKARIAAFFGFRLKSVAFTYAARLMNRGIVTQVQYAMRHEGWP